MEPVVYKLTALSDDHPSWNSRMEAWWKNGGALLWNRFGGVGAEELVLGSDDVREFMRCAKAIPGWNPLFHEECLESGCLPKDTNAVQIREMPAIDEGLPRTSVAPNEKVPTLCCMNCGRGIYPDLQSWWQADEIMLPKHALNHLLNGLDEAIEFARGRGPNNWLVWSAALEDVAKLLADIDNG